MSNTSRNHHYIPQFYLKGFLDPADTKKQIHVIEKKERRCFCTNPRNVGAQRDFNGVEGPGFPIDDAERRVFGLIDRKAEKALKYIAGNVTMPEDMTMMRNLIYFVAVLAVHNPHIRHTIINVETERHKQRMRLLVSSREMYEYQLEQVNSVSKEVSYEKMKQFVEEDNFTIKYRLGYHLGHELETIQNVIFPLLSHMQWSLLIAGADASNFVCSDRPVVVFNIEPSYLRYSSITPKAPAVRGFELTMPLNLHMAVHAAFGDPPVITKVGEEDVAAINGITIHAATRQIYCPHLDFIFLDGEEMKSGRDLVSV